MKVLSNMRQTVAPVISLMVATLFAGSAIAQTNCDVCEEQVVINSDLASCFLANFDQFAGSAQPAILIDLSDCPESRSIIAAIPGPDLTAEKPKMVFMLSRDQLACLKKKLEEPGLVLDPLARIDLGTCG